MAFHINAKLSFIFLCISVYVFYTCEGYPTEESPSASEVYSVHLDTPKTATDSPVVSAIDLNNEITREAIPGSCTQFTFCLKGKCKVMECSQTWKIYLFDPITKTCVAPNSLEGIRLQSTCGPSGVYI